MQSGFFRDFKVKTAVADKNDTVRAVRVNDSSKAAGRKTSELEDIIKLCGDELQSCVIITCGSITPFIFTGS